MEQLFSNEYKYDKIIANASQTFGVPFSLIKGIIALESGFDEKSYRFEPHLNDASYGLMQIMYNTAKGLGYEGTKEGLFTPETNIFYGTKFISNLHKKYPNIFDVIASYNMGYPRPASKTTPLIIKIYGKPQPDWKYANEPYVRKVATYTAYYEAKQKDPLLAKQIFDSLKKKTFKELSTWEKISLTLSTLLKEEYQNWIQV